MPRLLPSLALLATLALGTGVLCACSATGGTPAGTADKSAAKGATPAAPPAPLARVPAPGRLRDRLPTSSDSDFNFGGGRRVRARDEAPAEDEEVVMADATAADAPAADARAAAARAARGPVASRAGELTPEERRRLSSLAPGAVAAHGIRVTWEALAVERDLVANPRLGRKPQQGVVADSKIVLVSDDHPAAFGRQKGRASTREKDGSQVAVLNAADLQLLVRGLREAGFYKVARPTDGVQPHFDDSEARGRVTIEMDGVSRTLLSLRGQGTQDATRDVPRIYSQAKQAVAVVRNQTPALSVVTTGGQPVKPRARLGAAKSRTLTPEEAAEVLGEEAPPKPVDDDWGLGK
jgi:hypothetical protein